VRRLAAVLALFSLCAIAAPPAQARRSTTYQRAVDLYWSGRVEEAVALYRKALSRAPADAALLTDLGLALGQLGQRKEAEERLRRAIELEPRRFYAYANLADLLATDDARWERHDEVASLLAGALSQLPARARAGRVSLTLALARFERATGRAREARAWLDSLADDELSATQRDTKARLLDAIDADERARALEDWPEPAATEAERRELTKAEQLRAAGAHAEALRAVAPLCRAHPTWRAPRWVRAQSLHAHRVVHE
jgi:Flp pilus assembly protein TadD